MPYISQSHYHKMKNSYRHDVARHLALVAMDGCLVTYGELSDLFGVNTRRWGDILGGIAIRCHEATLPMLSVIVVNAATRMPSPDAVLYHDLGLADESAISAEQERCFEQNWRTTPLGS